MKFSNGHKAHKDIILLIFYFLIVPALLFAQQADSEKPPQGTLKGKIVNAETQEPLIGVNVIVIGTVLGAATDLNGNFIVNNVPVGSYNVDFSYIGFQRVIRPDVIVRPERITFLNFGLQEIALQGEEIVVSAGYFQKEETEPTSSVSLNSEEVRRAPGSVGDVSRVLLALPSTAQVIDNVNDLMVRGGSSFENGFYVDNIRIPNINQFPSRGTTGGPIGMINVDFIEDVSFSAGGFSAAYGNKLSSIVDISFREGNTDKTEYQADLSLAGFGAIAEGPLPNNKGSWFLSARKSFLDLIVDMIGTGSAPRYGDVHGKLTYDLNNNHRISFLNIFGDSKIEHILEDSRDDGNPYYGKYDGMQNTFGMTWRYIWGGNGYSKTSVSHSFVSSDNIWNKTATETLSQTDTYTEGAVRLRNVNYYQLNSRNKIEFGVDTEYEYADYDYFFAPYISRLGVEEPGIQLNDKFNTSKSGAFISYTMNPAANTSVTMGIRGDYYEFNDRFHISPRISGSYNVSDRLTLNAAAGIYSQELPIFILSQKSENNMLKSPKAYHYIAGLEYMLTPTTKMSLEVYNKEYRNFPLDPGDPTFFTIDEGVMNFRPDYSLVDNGRAYSRGVELLIQKKLAKDFYGMVSGAYYRCRYKDYNGTWRDRMYDTKYIFNVLGGYKPGNKWEYSTRWNFSGGMPYSPFDQTLSTQLNSGVIDQTRIHSERFPNYHSLNFRVDRRFTFQSSSLVTYLSLWNVYNQKNVSFYYWNEIENKQDEIFQWSFIPLIGLEYEF